MKKLIIANWKLNKNSSDIKNWFESFSKIYVASEEVDVIICPASCYLELVNKLISEYSLISLSCGAQDVSIHLDGSHTGDVSAKQVKDFADFTIVGHSERGESQEQVAEKLNACVSSNLTPVLCLKGINDFNNDLNEKYILVWEDPSNISKDGVYKELSFDNIKSGFAQIRNIVGNDRQVLYGGSVNETVLGNVSEMLSYCNGFLVGKASLDPQTSNSLIESLK